MSVNWSSNKVEHFKETVNKSKIKDVEDMLSNFQSGESGELNQGDIDNVVNSIGNIFTECASDLGIMKKVNGKRRNCRKSNNKPWYNEECETKRRLYLHARNKYASSKLDTDRVEMKRLNKQYKMCLKQAYKKYHIELNIQLRHLRSSNPKTYWSMLREKSGKTNEDIPIDAETFFKHFQNLNNAEVNVEAETNVFNQGSVEYNGDLNISVVYTISSHQ